MIIVYQVILLLVIVISFLFVFGSKGDKETAGNATLLCVASILSFIASVMWL